MTAIKDIINLTIELRNKVKDRQLASEITRIQTLISALQSEHFAIIEKNTHLLAENFDLKKQLSNCKSKVKILHKKIANINQTYSKEMADLKERHKTEIANLRLTEKTEPYDPLTHGLK